MAKVALYKEFNDGYAYGEEYIRIFDNIDSAKKLLRKRILEDYQLELEELAKSDLTGSQDTVTDTYVSIMDDFKGTVSFYIVEEYEVEKGA